jgi:signal transduction histidine kinase
MEIRAVTRRAAAPRALYAAGLLVVLLVALLGAWFYSGWHDVQMRQRELMEAPRLTAERRASDLARELRSELDALIAREIGRPYFEYQNLMHDPRASAGINVSPSPLAHGPLDRLVLGYFQLDARGRATTPTVNEDVPELSELGRLADNRAFRDQVTRDLGRQLSPAASVANAPSTPQPPGPKAPGTQVVQVDPRVYAQNSRPNEVYTQQGQLPKVQPTVAPPEPVTITISPLEWRTLPFAGVPALIGVRQVHTPDGALAQGFVVDRAALSKWLAAKAGDMQVELRADDTIGAAVVPHWGLRVEPSEGTRAQASRDADAIARAFVIRFGGVGAIAVFAASLVLLVVTRAEKLARERSQFAAAAAHELRTPLAGLQLYGDMLADELGDPGKMRDYARRMSEDAARLGRVVSNMLGFSQLERGNLSVAAEMGGLGETLRELADHAQPALSRTGATLELAVPGDLRARFDRDALARIVGNLLDNAEKHGRSTGDRTIRLAAVDRGDVIEISVEDRGPGVTDKTKLFRAFSRGASGSDGPAGLGLGLALSRSLARAMGGELTYRARDGGGATFVLQLPRT